MKRPKLNEIDVKSVDLSAGGQMIITMSPGQWDHILQTTYNSGGILLEVRDKNGSEYIHKAFKKSQKEK